MTLTSDVEELMIKKRQKTNAPGINNNGIEMMWMKKHLNWITFRKSSISAFSTSIFSLLCFSKIFLFSWFGDGIATPFFIGFDSKKSFNVIHGSKEHCEASLQEVHLQQHVSKNLFKVGGHLQLLHSGCQTIWEGFFTFLFQHYYMIVDICIFPFSLICDMMGLMWSCNDLWWICIDSDFWHGQKDIEQTLKVL